MPSSCTAAVLLAFVVGGWGWRWDANSTPCDPAATVSSYEAQSHLDRASVFRACGVVGITGLLSTADVDRFRVALDQRVAAALQSRSKLRQQLLQAMRNRLSLSALADEVGKSSADDEWASYLWSGEWAKERNDGRIDVALPWSPPISSTTEQTVGKLLPLLHQIMGISGEGAPDAAELKRVNAVIGLTRNESGIVDQHWHRDESLLFAGVEVPGGGLVHAREGGVQLPPYALNIFVALTDLRPATSGATQFVLGSHMWADEWAADEANPPPGFDDWPEKAFHLPAGSVIISDYRTIHRGLANLSPNVRPLAMLVYGRQWWNDKTNYGEGDYGGVVPVKKQSSMRPVSHQSSVSKPSAEQAKRMFWGLVSKWEAGLSEQLRQEYFSQKASREEV